ncbi:Maf family protein [Kaistia geumhonensis]|uniref:Nucleoside triphosphate pyrophosphatase n=1 Tax=Kaistia geumhonensis TaxID=410839 RepID=A0ABU0M7X0_9HYPH|nr:Maf family protein [Kaistia geumhonensis]MCX5477767.1 Maf family protein [Kaistia geumhonensis]MDQ0517022.1 septum formation protein [Kaistia geumhonensis]
MTALILASTSAARKSLLANAGLVFARLAAPVDERALEAPLIAAGEPSEAIALALARAKAEAVLALRPGAVVIGADQVLDLGGRRLVKPGDRDGARRQIEELQGRTHRLVSAVVVAEGPGSAWQHVSDARLTMRRLSPAAIERYLDEAAEGIFGSVGAYHLEGVGVRLFEAIEGDYFTILGLPLLPLLGWLRSRGLIDQEKNP